MRGPIQGPTDHENSNPDRPRHHLRAVGSASASRSWPWTWRCRRVGDRRASGGCGRRGCHRQCVPAASGLLGAASGSPGPSGRGCCPGSRRRSGSGRGVCPGAAAAAGRGRPPGSGVLRPGVRRLLRAAAGGVLLSAAAGLLPRTRTSLPASGPSSFSCGFLGRMVSGWDPEPGQPPSGFRDSGPALGNQCGFLFGWGASARRIGA